MNSIIVIIFNCTHAYTRDYTLVIFIGYYYLLALSNIHLENVELISTFIQNWQPSWLRVCLGSAYFVETENFFTESTINKGKS